MICSSIPVNPAAQKLRFWVPSSLRLPAVGYLQRLVFSMSPVRLFCSLLLLSLVSSTAHSISPEIHELYSRLNKADEKWVPLPHDPRAWDDGLPVYRAYDSGSISNKNGISYVRAKYGDKFGEPSVYVLVAHCKKKRLVSLALGKDETDAGMSLALWNNGRIKFSDPNDGGDHTIWSIPGTSLSADKLFEAICTSRPNPSFQRTAAGGGR